MLKKTKYTYLVLFFTFSLLCLGFLQSQALGQEFITDQVYANALTDEVFPDIKLLKKIVTKIVDMIVLNNF